MELEGIINHSTKAIDVRMDMLFKTIDECSRHKTLLVEVAAIHHNESLRDELRPFKSVKELVSNAKYMEELLCRDPSESLFFRGIPFDTIQYYMDLRDYCEKS